MYCSELVFDAATHVGIDLSGIAIPIAWLDRSDRSVQVYLGQTRLNPDDPAWTIVTPRDLYWSNDLAPVPESDQLPQTTPRRTRQFIYDTLPGTTIKEKYRHLVQLWGRSKNITAVTGGSGEKIRYRFSAHGKDDREYSLILFGKFPEERALAEKILAALNTTGVSNAP